MRGVLEEGLGVDGSREMDVQVGALGHALEEGVQGKGSTFAGLLEGGCGSAFGRRRRGNARSLSGQR